MNTTPGLRRAREVKPGWWVLLTPIPGRNIQASAVWARVDRIADLFHGTEAGQGVRIMALRLIGTDKATVRVQAGLGEEITALSPEEADRYGLRFGPPPGGGS